MICLLIGEDVIDRLVSSDLTDNLVNREIWEDEKKNNI